MNNLQVYCLYIVYNDPGGYSRMKQGMLIVSLRGVNFRFWSCLGHSGQNTILIIFTYLPTPRIQKSGDI